ncbi:hypothetical protein K2173_019941 [Erythroxylum novogranatense]|uniref:Uncharacterized protein n=1 Tax=Erythroxylum novogranatense TaxID=1862640 RepID=A0AAV8U6I5_9ROSI|nr:hypothetical protein K2173_019941 [Erythroxylum novogranatense]
MAPKNNDAPAKGVNRGAWTAEEDRKLSECIEVHGAKRWKTVAIKAGLNRCGKSCRLRWLNYLRPNIKRGNISPDEEDLIIRLHKLLGNRWSLNARRLPGRTDNEIKNYWNSHLSKKTNHKETIVASSTTKQEGVPQVRHDSSQPPPHMDTEEIESSEDNFDVNDFFDFSAETCYVLEWVNKFLQLDQDQMLNEKR